MNDPDLLREQVRAWIDAHFDPGMTLRSWLELLADDPLLLRIPLGRWQHRLTIGLDEAAWKEWIAAGASMPPTQARPRT